MRTRKTRILGIPAVNLLVLLFALSCHDKNSPTPTTPGTTTTTAPAASTALVRVAQLIEDARSVDVLVNGNLLFHDVGYGRVTNYTELPAGEVRIQFFQAGTRRDVEAETTVTLPPGARFTFAIEGLDERIVAIQDQSAARSDRASIKLVNAVSDYPAPFDLAVVSGQTLVQGIAFTQSSSYSQLIPGMYDLEIMRTHTSDTVAVTEGLDLRSGASYTLFAVGTLRRDDIELVLALDAG